MTDQGIAGLDVQAIETEIGRLPEVVACRIVADAVGRPVEVHVLAHPGKHPKQVVRDVQSVALASFGLEIVRAVLGRALERSGRDVPFDIAEQITGLEAFDA